MTASCSNLQQFLSRINQELLKSQSISPAEAPQFIGTMSSSAEPWTAPENPSPNLQIALAYNDAMERWDEEALMSTFDETLEHRILPKSLTRPVLNKSLYRSYFQHLASMFKPAATKVSNCYLTKKSDRKLTIALLAYDTRSGRVRRLCCHACEAPILTFVHCCLMLTTF